MDATVTLPTDQPIADAETIEQTCCDRKVRFLEFFWELKILLWGTAVIAVAYVVTYGLTWAKNSNLL